MADRRAAGAARATCPASRPGRRSRSRPSRPPFARQSFTVDDVNPWLADAGAVPGDEGARRARRTAQAAGRIFTPPGVGATRSRCRATRADRTGARRPPIPQKGMVFVVGVNQVAILKLEDVTKRSAEAGRGGGGGGSAVAAGRASRRISSTARPATARICGRRCRACRRSSASPTAWARTRSRRSSPAGADRCGPISEHHRGRADGDRSRISATRARPAAAAAVAGAAAARGRRFPPGPVVASGGAPQPPLPPRCSGPFYPGVGGNAGNTPYPADVKDVPPTRYMTRLRRAGDVRPSRRTRRSRPTTSTPARSSGRCRTATTRRRSRAGGPANTGGVGARNGMVVTKGGLVFHAGNDGKVRAYDEDTGKVLWTGTLPGRRAACR